MAKWITKTIRETIQQIDNKEFVLPVIQRRLVWSHEKMEMLFDSLLQKSSFGGIMVIEENKGSKPLFDFRLFVKNGEIQTSQALQELDNQQYFVIDGQQRLQAFYIGLLGKYEGKTLFFNLYSPQDCHTYDFKFAKDTTDELPVNTKEYDNRNITECFWYSVPKLYDKLLHYQDSKEVYKDIVKTENILDEVLKELVRDNIDTFHSVIFSHDVIGISKILLNKNDDENESRKRIVEIFRRLNSQGTPLSTVDLIASKLKGFDSRMEEFLETTVQQYEPIRLGQDELIKLLFLLQDNSSKEIMDIELEDAQFALDNKEKIWQALKDTEIFLKLANFQDYYSSGNRSFIPLYFITYFFFYHDINLSEETLDANFNTIKEWLKYSLLYKVFSRGSGWRPDTTGIRRILQIMAQYKENDLFPKEPLFELYQEKIHNFSSNIDPKHIANFDTTPLLYLLYGKQLFPKDMDHIHPKSRLKGRYDDTDINHIANCQLLDSSVNRGDKNDTSFDKWIEKIQKDLENQNSNINSYLVRHYIPSDKTLWHEDRFNDFIKERSILIYEQIKLY